MTKIFNVLGKSKVAALIAISCLSACVGGGSASSDNTGGGSGAEDELPVYTLTQNIDLQNAERFMASAIDLSRITNAIYDTNFFAFNKGARGPLGSALITKLSQNESNFNLSGSCSYGGSVTLTANNLVLDVNNGFNDPDLDSSQRPSELYAGSISLQFIDCITAVTRSASSVADDRVYRVNGDATINKIYISRDNPSVSRYTATFDGLRLIQYAGTPQAPGSAILDYTLQGDARISQSNWSNGAGNQFFSLAMTASDNSTAAIELITEQLTANYEFRSDQSSAFNYFKSRSGYFRFVDPAASTNPTFVKFSNVISNRSDAKALAVDGIEGDRIIISTDAMDDAILIGTDPVLFILSTEPPVSKPTYAKRIPLAEIGKNLPRLSVFDHTVGIDPVAAAISTPIEIHKKIGQVVYIPTKYIFDEDYNFISLSIDANVPLHSEQAECRNNNYTFTPIDEDGSAGTTQESDLCRLEKFPGFKTEQMFVMQTSPTLINNAQYKTYTVTVTATYEDPQGNLTPISDSLRVIVCADYVSGPSSSERRCN